MRPSTRQLIRDWADHILDTVRHVWLEAVDAVRDQWLDRPQRQTRLDDEPSPAKPTESELSGLITRRDQIQRRMEANDWSESGLQLYTPQDHADSATLRHINARIKELEKETPCPDSAN